MFGNPVFRVVVALLSCAILILLYTTSSEARDTQRRSVGLVQLLSSPEKFTGERVSVRGYLGHGGSPGTLFYSRALAGDPSNGIALLDARADNAIRNDPQLAACVSGANVEVTGVVAEIRPRTFALLSVQRISALDDAAPSCHWNRAL